MQISCFMSVKMPAKITKGVACGYRTQLVYKVSPVSDNLGRNELKAANPEAHSKPSQTSKIEIHLRYFTGFWIRLCNQTIKSYVILIVYQNFLETHHTFINSYSMYELLHACYLILYNDPRKYSVDIQFNSNHNIYFHAALLFLLCLF